MSTTHESTLHQTLRGRCPEILADWRTRLHGVGGNYLLGLTPETELAAEMQALLDGFLAALPGPGERPLIPEGHVLERALHAASLVRAARGFTPQESLFFLQTCKEALIAVLRAETPLSASADGQRIDLLMDCCVRILVASFVAAREDVITRQSASLREVSTPVITLWDSILLLPLIGVVDSVRAQQIAERLLESISEHEAAVTLIDVTGVPVMDTSVARHLLKTVAAAEMLGTQVILTGISPSTAQTIVKLGIDMSAVPTRASLKSGMALALTMTRRAIVSNAPD